MKRRKSVCVRLLAAGVGIAVISLTGLAGLAGASRLPASALPATGNGITPSVEPGSSEFSSCEAATDEAHIMGLKLEKGGAVSSYNGTYDRSSSGVVASHGSSNPMQITIANAQVASGAATFSWTANLPVDYIFVKAGSSATVYDYSRYGWGGHPARGPFGDTGLVSPKDSISHVLFCTIKRLHVEKTATGTVDRTYAWAISKQVKTDGAYGASATLALPFGGSGSATWKVVATRTGATDGNATVRGTIAVLNASPFSASVQLTESLAGAVLDPGCTTFTLAIGARRECGYSAKPGSATPGTNTVTARATNLAWMDTASASAGYDFAGSPATEVDKTVRWSDSNGRAQAGLTDTTTTEYATTAQCDRDQGSRDNVVRLYGDNDVKLGEATATLEVTCAPKPQEQPAGKTPDAPPSSVTASPQSPVTPPPAATQTVVTPPASTPASPPSAGTAPAATPQTPVLTPPVAPAPKRPAKPVAKPPVRKSVKRPVRKPVAKPAPKPKATPTTVPCASVRLSVRAIPAGKRAPVTFLVTAGGKPVRGATVRIQGPGILKLVRTGPAGRGTTSMKPGAPGIVSVRVVSRPACSSARLGATSPFEPPVTG